MAGVEANRKSEEGELVEAKLAGTRRTGAGFAQGEWQGRTMLKEMSLAGVEAGSPGSGLAGIGLAGLRLAEAMLVKVKRLGLRLDGVG